MLERREVSPATSTDFASTSCKQKGIGIKSNCFFLGGLISIIIYNNIYIYISIYHYMSICCLKAYSNKTN
jgi:hypothetical protein